MKLGYELKLVEEDNIVHTNKIRINIIGDDKEIFLEKVTRAYTDRYDPECIKWDYESYKNRISKFLDSTVYLYEDTKSLRFKKRNELINAIKSYNSEDECNADKVNELTKSIYKTLKFLACKEDVALCEVGEFDTRTSNALKRAGIFTIYKLKEIFENNSIFDMKGFGPKTIYSSREIIDKYYIKSPL